MGIATFNTHCTICGIETLMATDDDIFEMNSHNTIRRLNFAEEQDEAKTLLS